MMPNGMMATAPKRPADPRKFNSAAFGAAAGGSSRPRCSPQRIATRMCGTVGETVVYTGLEAAFATVSERG